jgi:prepilin-type N-terminal cleavage/methylation domain-containing protein
MTTQRGFTLIEMAIVLVIITILIGGLAMPLSAQIQARRIGETNKTLEEAREAIVGYAMGNTTTTCTCAYTVSGFDPASTTCSPSLCPATGLLTTTGTAALTLQPRHYLPCPDAQTDPDYVDNDGDGELSDINNGLEDRKADGSCLQDVGNFPWVTLGTASQDAWGNRLRYQVTATFADRSTGLPGTVGGDLQICNTSTNAGTSDCGALGNVASNVVAVVMSHGPNGWGARNVNNTTLADPTSNNEKENANTDHADTEFVSRTPSDDFDDLIRWISAPQLRGRVCPSGGCP